MSGRHVQIMARTPEGDVLMDRTLSVHNQRDMESLQRKVVALARAAANGTYIRIELGKGGV